MISSFCILKLKWRCVNGRKYMHRGATPVASEYHIPSDIRGMVMLLSRKIVQEFKPPRFKCTHTENELHF